MVAPSTPGSTPSQIINIQRGLVSGHKIISKFAENPAIQTATAANIWDYGVTSGAEVYTFSATADINSISSSDNTDDQLIIIQGLDANWLEVTQTATLIGQTRVPLDTPLIRVWRMFNGNGTATAGNVYVYPNTAITTGVPNDVTKVRAYFSIAEQNTLMGIYTIPAGKTGYFLGLDASISKQPAAGNCIFTGKARVFGGIFRTQIRFNLASTGTSHINVPGTAATAFPEKTDLVASGDVTVNSTGVSVTLDILLVDN